MRLRIVKVDEYQFLTCFKHGLWGSHRNRFKDWMSGDYVLFTVTKHLAGVAKVVGEPYVSDDVVWDNGVFSHRIPVHFEHILSVDHRVPILGDVRDILISEWGQSYGFGILNQQTITGESAGTLVAEVKKMPNAVIYYKDEIDYLMREAREQRDSYLEMHKRSHASLGGPPQNGTSPAGVAQITSIETDDAAVVNASDGTGHSKAQSLLAQLGRITGCSVWIASNDRNRMFNGHQLGEHCIDSLPNFGLSKQAMERITYIDTIWIQKQAPICAFEVETTTSVYSGLLRMSDLISLVPTLKIQLFIVAPKARQKKVMDELSRPTFKKIGLDDYCRFIPLEDLESLVDKVEGLYGHVKASIINDISIEVDSEEKCN